MRIVLDTGVLFEPRALRHAVASGLRVILPAVAFAERARLVRDAGSVDVLVHWLHRARIDVEPFGASQAIRLAKFTLPEADWSRHARDALIASHLGPADQLWTGNVRDFVKVGIPPAAIIDVRDVAKVGP
jgi:predicted nucleic acid-binding protein